MNREVAAAIVLGATLLCLQVSVDAFALRETFCRGTHLPTQNAERRENPRRYCESHAKASIQVRDLSRY